MSKVNDSRSQLKPIPAPAGVDEPEGPQPHVQVEQRRLTLGELLKTVVRLNGSDLHLQAGSAPMIRVDGRVRFLDTAPSTDAELGDYVAQLLKDPEKASALRSRGSVDLAYSAGEGQTRFRVNIFHSREKYAIVMRRIVTRIPSFEELNLPPQLEALAEHNRGIVVISGTTGCGKSTTLAAIIGKINRTRNDRILTIEDPVEYHHDNIKSMVSQVEVGTDSESYEYALRAMMRQDPDTIQIGEIRDTFSLTTALRAADTGHLVFTTVHATNAAMTIERMASLFDLEQKDLQRTQLGMNLVAVVCQRLAKKREGKGRVPVVEILTVTPLVRKYILEGEYDKIAGLVNNREAGSQSFDQHLAELFGKQIIDVGEARRLATNPDALNLALRGISNSDNRLGGR